MSQHYWLIEGIGFQVEEAISKGILSVPAIVSALPKEIASKYLPDEKRSDEDVVRVMDAVTSDLGYFSIAEFLLNNVSKEHICEAGQLDADRRVGHSDESYVLFARAYPWERTDTSGVRSREEVISLMVRVMDRFVAEGRKADLYALIDNGGYNDISVECYG